MGAGDIIQKEMCISYALRYYRSWIILMHSTA